MIRLPLDVPMPLGDHLDELRRMIWTPLITFGVLFVAAFSLLHWLRMIYVWPLARGIQIAAGWDPAAVERCGLPPSIDPWHPAGLRLLDVLSIGESVWNSVHLATMAALTLTLPIFLYQLWRFVAVGLHDNERSLGFLLLPMGVIFFYCGGIFGYLVGIPYAIAWFVSWSAADPIVHEIRFRMSDYQATFFNWTLIFGGLLDIPWAIMVLVRVRIVTVAFLSRQRRFAVFGAVVLAGALAPDAMSMAIVAPPLYALFEIGLLFAWLIDWDARRKARAVAKRENAE